MSSILNPSISVKGSTFFADPSTVITVITIPPDGGWGWIIVIASLFANLIVDGIIYTFGLYLNDIAASFDVLPTTVAIASSLINVSYYCFGALTCALVNRFGFRAVGAVGGLIATCGYMLSSVTTSIVPFLLITGIVAGIGLGMIFVASVVIVGFYFERWRSLATSLAVTGSSLGIVVMPLVNDKLLHGFDWRTKFQIISASLFATVLLALLYKPLKPTRILKKGNQVVEINDIDSIDSNKQTTSNMFNSFHNKKYPTAAEYAEKDSATLESSNLLISAIESIIRSEDMRSLPSSIYSVTETVEFEPSSPEEPARKPTRCCHMPKLCSVKQDNRPMYRDDIFYRGSLNMLTQYSKSMMNISRLTTPTSSAIPASLEYHMSVSRVATAADLANRRICCPESIVRILATMLDLSLLKSPSFALLNLSGFFTSLGMYVPFIYSINRGEEVGIERSDASLLLSALGISNGVGRIVSGVVTSIPGANATLVTYVSLTVCGLATLGSCWLYGLPMQYLYVLVYGLTIACFGSLRPSMIVELVGLENLTNAFGVTLLFEGVGAFAGVPLAGQLMVASGTYQACFYFSGVSIALSGVSLIPIESIAKWEQKRRKDNA